MPSLSALWLLLLPPGSRELCGFVVSGCPKAGLSPETAMSRWHFIFLCPCVSGGWLLSILLGFRAVGGETGRAREPPERQKEKEKETCLGLHPDRWDSLSSAPLG